MSTPTTAASSASPSLRTSILMAFRSIPSAAASHAAASAIVAENPLTGANRPLKPLDMRTRLRRSILATLACVPLLTVAACAEWQGTNAVSTDVGGGALGTGPGLITGTRGGLII